MKKLYIVILSILSFLHINAQQYRYMVEEMKAQARQERDRFARINGMGTQAGLRTVASQNIDIKHYRCEWEIDPAVRFITGKVTPTFVALGTVSTITLDMNTTLVVDSIVYHNARINHTRGLDHSLTIQFPAAITGGAKDSVSIFYKGIPANNGSGSFTTTTHAGTPLLSTLSEPYGARDWWPCKDGLNDKADSIDIIITCPVAYRNSSNGLLVNEQTTATKRISWYKHKYPIASYLVAIACTNYVIRSHNVDINGRNLVFENWTYPESELNFEAEAYGVENALKWFSGYFGDYPFMNERYAQTQFNYGGGMEHQTNSFMAGPNHLLQAHELGHQWFGDKSTCGSWQHIWVNEGFASFAHWLYFQTHDLPTYLGIRYEYHETVLAERNGKLFVDDTLSVGRIFDWRLSYVKGSYVLHMLRGMLGDEKFFQAMKQYSNDPAVRYGFARTEDVKRNFEQVSGRDLTEFFNDWVYGEGYPTYLVYWYVNNNGWINMQINQLQSDPSVSFFEMPVQVKFKAAGIDSTVTFDVRQNGQLFSLKLPFTPDTLEVDPNLWLLSKNDVQIKQNKPVTDQVKVFPNPAQGGTAWNFQIRNPTASEYNVALYSASGQLLYRKTINTPGSDLNGEIPNATLPTGVYQLHISRNGGKNNITKKLLKL